MRRLLVVGLFVAATLAAFAMTSGAVPFGHLRSETEAAPDTVARRRAVTRPPPPAAIRVRDPDLMRLSGLTPETTPVRSLEGTRWVSVNGLARLLGAAKFWRSDLRRFELRVAGHRVLLIVDNPFALVDDEMFTLDPPPRSLGGELFVPISFLDRLPSDSTVARLRYASGRGVVLQVPATGVVNSPTVAANERETTIGFPADRPDEVVVASRSRANFRIRLDGYFVGTLPDSFPRAALVRRVREIPTAGGCAFEFSVAPEAAGYRVISDRAAGRLTLTFDRVLGPQVEAFAPEAPPGRRPLRVVVLDPGHGGGDAGVRAGGLEEKDLTLSLALALKSELEGRTAARVLLTRGREDAPTNAARAEFANRARADLVLSLHFDGLPASASRGVTAYCPPAVFAAASGVNDPRGMIALRPWRDVATRHAATSRALAESILSLLELRNQGPARLREVLPYALLGVNAPGLVLECATLSSESDRARISDPAGVQALAATIADAIAAYERGE